MGAGRDEAFPATGGEPSIRFVLEWYTRRLTADRFPNRKRVVVPPPLAGWVLPAEGEPADPDGLRPIGAVRDALVALIEKAELPKQEHAALLARTGLSEYPAGTGVRRPLGQRLPVQRRRRSGGGLGERRLRKLHEVAIRQLDRMNVTDPRPGEEPEAGPVSDPAGAAWFLEQVGIEDQPRVLERAVDEARSFVAVGGPSGATRGPLGDLDDYLRALQTCEQSRIWPPPRRLGRTRAHALVGLALWDLVTAREYVGALAAVRSGRLGLPADFVCASESLGRLLAGDHDPETVTAVCSEVLDRTRTDRHTADVLSDLLLGCFLQHQGNVPPQVEAEILRTVIFVRSGNEDPTALGLVQRLIMDHPRRPETIKAAQRAVRVASGHRHFRRADELCDFVDKALLHGLVLAPSQSRAVEDAEFKLWNTHQRTATLRRQLDLRVSTGVLRKALALSDEVRRHFEYVQQLNTKVGPGDARESWGYFFEVRSAEIHLVAAAAADGSAASQRRQVAQRYALAASNIARSFSPSDPSITFVPVAKVDLRAALLLGNQDLAASILWELHRLGWPLSRTVSPVPAMAVGVAAGRSRLPKVYEAVQEIVELEKADGGRSLIADGSNRERWAASSPGERTV